MKKCAIIIGVNKTGGLPVLNAAASGAREFARWASKQGYEVVLLTDEKGKAVTISDIKQAVRGFTQQGTFSQMIVFFSGHGILKSPDYELWLLSGAPADPDEAVNVPGSISYARNSGIPHVVVISDACRSSPDDLTLNSILGGIIFPNQPSKKIRPEVDVFYATRPGYPALEVPLADAVKNYHAIFTSCLLKGLGGTVQEVVEQVEDPPLIRWIIRSRKLKSYLEQEVPNIASKVSIKLQQDPEIRVESDLPNFMAEIAAPKGVTRGTRGLPAKALESHATTFSFKELVEGYKQSQYFNRNISLSAEAEELAQESDFGPAMDRLMNARGRESFETRTGFTVIGARITRAIVASLGYKVFEEDNADHIRVHILDEQSSLARSALIQFDSGYGTALAVLPGFIGTVVVEDERIVNVSYTPSRHTDRYNEYETVANEIEKRRAFVAVAARHGSFHIEREKAAKYADSLREFKGFDPTLGLYAAYAYAQVGAFEQVESVYKFMRGEPEPIPFDVALLANRLLKSSPGYKPVAPFCPMLTQGWALLEPFAKEMPEIIHQAGRHLVPALWTTFRPEILDLLWLAIEGGDLK
jgi:hypothetical protein